MLSPSPIESRIKISKNQFWVEGPTGKYFGPFRDYGLAVFVCKEVIELKRIKEFFDEFKKIEDKKLKEYFEKELEFKKKSYEALSAIHLSINELHVAIDEIVTPYHNDHSMPSPKPSSDFKYPWE